MQIGPLQQSTLKVVMVSNYNGSGGGNANN